MDRPRRNFVIAMDGSGKSIHVYKRNPNRSDVLERKRQNFLIEMEKARSSPRSHLKIYKTSSECLCDSDSEDDFKFDIVEEEPSYFHKMIWNIIDYFEKNKVKETKPKRNTFTIKDVEECRKYPNGKSEIKIRSVRDLIDHWYFKSLAKDLTKIQPEPLKIKTKMRCLNYILDAQKSDYEKAISKELYECYGD